MSYFKNITAGEMCVWRNEIIRFDPDSSPPAWTHYRTIYEGRMEGYDFSHLVFYNYHSKLSNLNKCFCEERNIWLNYIDLPSPDSRDYNRLLALKNDTLSEYSGRFYTSIPEIGNRRSDVKETALPF